MWNPLRSSISNLWGRPNVKDVRCFSLLCKLFFLSLLPFVWLCILIDPKIKKKTKTRRLRQDGNIINLWMFSYQRVSLCGFKLETVSDVHSHRVLVNLQILRLIFFRCCCSRHVFLLPIRWPLNNNISILC